MQLRFSTQPITHFIINPTKMAHSTEHLRMMEEGIGRHSKLVTVIASYRLEDLCVSRRGKRFKIIEESAPLVLPSGGTTRWNNFRDRLCSPLNPGSLLIFLDVQELGSQLCRPRTDWKESGQVLLEFEWGEKLAGWVTCDCKSFPIRSRFLLLSLSRVIVLGIVRKLPIMYIERIYKIWIPDRGIL